MKFMILYFCSKIPNILTKIIKGDGTNVSKLVFLSTLNVYLEKKCFQTNKRNCSHKYFKKLRILAKYVKIITEKLKIITKNHLKIIIEKMNNLIGIMEQWQIRLKHGHHE